MLDQFIVTHHHFMVDHDRFYYLPKPMHLLLHSYQQALILSSEFCDHLMVKTSNTFYKLLSNKINIEHHHQIFYKEDQLNKMFS